MALFSDAVKFRLTSERQFCSSTLYRIHALTCNGDGYRRAHPIHCNGQQHADSILPLAKKMDGCVRLGGVWWGVGVCGGWQGRGGVVGSVVSFFVFETSFCHQR